MQGFKRRIVFVVLYEAIAIVAASIGFSLMSDQGIGHAGPLAVFASITAVMWTLAFNAMFERWESRQAVRGRSIRRRIAHAVGFEGGLVAFQVPVVAWWLEVGLWDALLMDLGLVAFFLVYAFVFNWLFDLAFGLPASAAEPGDGAAAAVSAVSAVSAAAADTTGHLRTARQAATVASSDSTAQPAMTGP